MDGVVSESHIRKDKFDGLEIKCPACRKYTYTGIVTSGDSTLKVNNATVRCRSCWNDISFSFTI